jgi:hypothetical protein
MALATATGLLGCGGKEADFEWGIPYQPTAGADEDDNDDPPPDDDDGQAGSDEGGGPPPDPDSGPATTSGPDPTLTTSASASGESGSTGIPGDSADTGESPYQGGWDIGNCQDEMSSEVADFQLIDSYGDQVRLYDFCHKAIMLTAGSFW